MGALWSVAPSFRLDVITERAWPIKRGRRIRMTDRRSFIKVLAGAALLGVGSSAGAETTKSFTIAYLALLPGEDRSFVPYFLCRLDQLGYVDGKKLRFVYRSAEGRPELLPGLA